MTDNPVCWDQGRDSAGTYSIMQPALSRPMPPGKVDALEAGHPHLVANVGCYA